MGPLDKVITPVRREEPESLHQKEDAFIPDAQGLVL